MKIHLKTDFTGPPPTPFKRPNGIYYIRQRVAGRDVWRSLRTKKKSEAVFLALEIWRNRQADLIQSIIKVPALPFPLIWEKYIQTEKFTNLSESTKRTKNVRFVAFKKWADSKKVKTLEELTVIDCEKYLSQCGKTNKTFNNTLNDLKTIFSVLEDSENHFTKIAQRSISAAGRESKVYPAFDDETVQRIFELLENSKLKNKREWIIACKIASVTGLRFKDVALLQKKSIKSDEKSLYIELSPHKTSKKTQNAKVLIRLFGETAQLLKTEMFFKSLDDYVLPVISDNYIRCGENAEQSFLRLLARHGIVGRFHSFRVSIASKAQKAGVSEKVAGGFLGHTNENQTKHYNRAALEIDMEKVVNEKLSVENL